MISNRYHEKYSNYHYCIVRECKNTSLKTPGKLWIKVPKEINLRNTWLELAKSDPATLSTHSKIYFCEDHFDFCLPVTDWPQCDADKTTLSIGADYDRINPDELEELHHQNREIAPPNITFNCQCRNPNYWRLKSNPDDTTGYRHYRCGSLPLCRTGELCGHVTTDLFALYQSCLCPKSHICVQNGGITYEAASELLYHGTVWNAYCRRVGDESSYEDY